MPEQLSRFLIDTTQGRQGEFEPGKVQYSTPKFFDRLFLIRAYWNPKSRQGTNLACLPCRGGPEAFSMHIGPQAMIVSAIRISADVRSIVFHYCNSCLLHNRIMLVCLLFCNGCSSGGSKSWAPIIGFLSSLSFWLLTLRLVMVAYSYLIWYIELMAHYICIL